jgi:hypothetical protein
LKQKEANSASVKLAAEKKAQVAKEKSTAAEKVRINQIDAAFTKGDGHAASA